MIITLEVIKNCFEIIKNCIAVDDYKSGYKKY